MITSTSFHCGFHEEIMKTPLKAYMSIATDCLVLQCGSGELNIFANRKQLGLIRDTITEWLTKTAPTRECVTNPLEEVKEFVEAVKEVNAEENAGGDLL